MSKDIFLRLSLLFSLSKNFEFWMPFYQDESINLPNFLKILDMDLYHRVSIEWKSPYKESYTVNSHRKSFDYVLSDVRACVRFQN